jgi:hypothetical protein
VGQLFKVHNPNQHDFDKCGMSSFQVRGVTDEDGKTTLTAAEQATVALGPRRAPRHDGGQGKHKCEPETSG